MKWSWHISHRHLSDEQLLSIWYESGPHPHLDDCAECRTRGGELWTLLDSVRQEAVAEADRVFTPERLAAQREQVLRRLERAQHPVRVISFPRPRLAAPVTQVVRHRWIAMAAAAGLIFGVVIGTTFNFRPDGSRLLGGRPDEVGQIAAARPGAGRPAVAAPASHVITPFNDEAFLGELEAASLAPRIEALQAIDALTPGGREVIPVALVR